jgi:PAS domain S-box-containing protein
VQLDRRFVAGGVGAVFAGALAALFLGTRRRIEQAFRRFVETAPDAILLLGPDGRVLSANGAAERLFGYPSEDLAGWPVERLVPDAFREEHARGRTAWMAHPQSGRMTANGHVTGRRSNGSTFPADVLVGLPGKGLVALSVRDLTPLRVLEAKVEAFATEARDLYEHAPCGYHSLDAQGRFVRLNETEARWLGRPREEILGRSFREFLTPASQALFDARFPVFQRTGVIEDAEFELAAADGSTRTVTAHANMVRDADGSFLRTRSTLVDVTRRKRAEAERESLVAELRQALAEVRTLSGLLPICAWCKKIRTDQGYWQQIEAFVSDHTQAEFTHGICPDCKARLDEEKRARQASTGPG